MDENATIFIIEQKTGDIEIQYTGKITLASVARRLSNLLEERTKPPNLKFTIYSTGGNADAAFMFIDQVRTWRKLGKVATIETIATGLEVAIRRDRQLYEDIFPKELLPKLLGSQTWMTSEEYVKLGFAHEVL